MTTAVTLRILPELAVLLRYALTLLRERGWQGWGFEDQGVLSIDGALVVAAGGTATGQSVELDGQPLALAQAASSHIVEVNKLPVGPDCLWEWEYQDTTTQADAIRAVELTYAVYVAGTRLPVSFANPLGDHHRPVLFGMARRYRDDHMLEVDCGAYGTVWAAPHQVFLDDGTRRR